MQQIKQKESLKERELFGPGQSHGKRYLSLFVLFAFISLLIVPKIFSQEAKSELPKGKQTKLGLYVTSNEAYSKWVSAPDDVKIIDVRTPEEYIFIGHAEMAWNIPFAYQTYEWDAEKKHFSMKPNADFVSQVKELFKLDDIILVTCRSGGRSAISVNMLAAEGFKNVYNITDGFEGDKVKDPDNLYHGKRMKNGWKNSDVPWTYGLIPDKMIIKQEK